MVMSDSIRDRVGDALLSRSNTPTLTLPKAWPKRIHAAVLQVISLAHFAIVYSRSWAVNSPIARVRLKAENDQLKQQVALLTEEIRIKDGRMARITPLKRPHYSPIDRMAILELRASRGWSTQQTADVFQVTAATVTSWNKRLDEQGPDPLLQLREPVNRFPDFVHYLVQRLKVLCPILGKVKIAQVLARAGLHMAPTTVGRILREAPCPKSAASAEAEGRVVTADRPNHVWHVDLTTGPTSAGFWASWSPFAVPQVWPFCWWVAVALDHYSRRVMGVTIFKTPPNSEAVRAFLGRSIHTAQATPKYVICDKGPQFWYSGFKAWCRKRNIRPRYGAIGQHGSLAVIERCILTLKTECTRRILVSLRRDAFRRELSLYAQWYNEYRPHMALDGKAPNEVYHNREPANEQPRLEPRTRWPCGAPCAAPQTPVRGTRGIHIELSLRCHAGRRHLPVVTLKRAA